MVKQQVYKSSVNDRGEKQQVYYNLWQVSEIGAG